jgi:integron integrase
VPPFSVPGSPLLQSVVDALVLRHYGPKTVEAYIGWVHRFVVFHDRRHPRSLGAREVSVFLSDLASRGGVSASTQNQALAALLFLYAEVLQRPLGSLGQVVHAKRPIRLPVVMTRNEVNMVLSRLSGVWLLMASPLYGSGLRVLECASLRVKDVDFGGGQLLVRRGKGQKDRATLLPKSLVEPLEAHLASPRARGPREVVRGRHGLDLREGAGHVELPGALRAKYPNASREWPWQWVFPATRRYVDPVTGEQRRHHLHETALQRAVRTAAVNASISTCRLSHVPSLICDPPVGSRLRHPNHPKALGASGSAHDHDLYACTQSRSLGRKEPARSLTCRRH